MAFLIISHLGLVATSSFLEIFAAACQMVLVPIDIVRRYGHKRVVKFSAFETVYKVVCKTIL